MVRFSLCGFSFCFISRIGHDPFCNVRTDRQTDKYKVKQTDRETDKFKDKQIGIDLKTNRQTYRLKDRQKNRQIKRQTNRQIDLKTKPNRLIKDRRTYKKTHKRWTLYIFAMLGDK
jgi:hypothetical protein